MTDYSLARHNMIQQQIRPWEVLDPRVLDVFDQVNRDHFVADRYKGLAYADCKIPVIEGESMLPPTVEGRMLQALRLEPGDTVLEIGTGCGYITACLANLASQVTSVDIHAEATELARNNLEPLNLKNIILGSISGLQDVNYSKRFDAIVVSAGSLKDIPQNLKDALAINGRLFAVTGDSPAKHAMLVTRVSHDEWVSEGLFETDIADL